MPNSLSDNRPWLNGYKLQFVYYGGIFLERILWCRLLRVAGLPNFVLGESSAKNERGGASEANGFKWTRHVTHQTTKVRVFDQTVSDFYWIWEWPALASKRADLFDCYRQNLETGTCAFHWEDDGPPVVFVGHRRGQ